MLKRLFSRNETKRDGAIIWTKDEIAKARKINNNKARLDKMDKAANVWETVRTTAL